MPSGFAFSYWPCILFLKNNTITIRQVGLFSSEMLSLKLQTYSSKTMKHFYFLILILAPVFVQSQNITFGDPDVKLALLSQCDTNSDNEISLSEAALITEIELWDGVFTSYEGMQFFVNLERLRIMEQHSAIVLPEITSVKRLEIDTCYPSLTLSNSPNLEVITMTYTDNLTSFTYPLLPALKELNVDNAGLSTLNTTNIPNIEKLILGGTRFPSLDVSSLTYLKEYGMFSYELLPTFALGNMPQLESLWVWGPNLNMLNLYNLPGLKNLDIILTNIGVLDLSGCPNLISLTCDAYAGSTVTVTDLGLDDVPLLENLKCVNTGLTALDLAPVPALKTLDCRNNALTALSLSAVPQLESLKCSNNSLTALNVSPVPALKTLDCSINQITSLNVTGLPLLESFSCSYNPLTGPLDVSNCTHLQSLACRETNRSSLDVSALTDLRFLDFSTNSVSQIDLSNSPKLSNLRASNNLLVALDLSQQTVSTGGNRNFWFNSNPGLMQVNLKNGLNDHVESEGCPNLAYACIDESEHEENYLLEELEYENNHDIHVSTYCTFNPGGNFNTINATVTYDAANDGCQNDNMHFAAIPMSIDYGPETGATFTNAAGVAKFFTQEGIFPVTATFDNPYFSLSPATQSATFANDQNNVANLTFCIVPVGIHTDAEITITPTTPAQPGFDSGYLVTVSNVGNQLISGNATFQYNESVLDYVSASVAPDTQSAGNLLWNFSNLAPFQSLSFQVTLNLNSPMETPAVNIDDLLPFTAAVNPAVTDETPANNVYEFTQTVVGSFDPNDKTCVEGRFITPEMIGDYLHYVIRFQNSGTAPAQNIVVKDVIDTTKFEMETLQLTAASHAYATRIDANKIEFIFENINLPAEQDDEPGSHGFVAFKIKTKSNLTVNSSVSNQADIFFDYNFPIVTEPAVSTFSTLGRNSFEGQNVSVYPNPAKNQLTIRAQDNIQSVQLYDVSGRLIRASAEAQSQAYLDLSQESAGIYFVKITTQQGSKTEKIIKQ